MKKRAFTLIELLVVIAIIAILAAILFPVFAKARERAKASACINNMKQLSTAFMTYFQDNDESFPPFTAVGRWGDKQGWSERIFPHINSIEVYGCPSAKTNFSYSMNAASSRNVVSSISRVRSPAKFMHLVEAPGSGRGEIKLNSTLPNPASTGDSDLTTEYTQPVQAPDFRNNQWDGYVYGDASGKQTNAPAASPMNITKVTDMGFANQAPYHIGQLYFPGRHSEGNNIMFLDGHVRAFKGWSDGSMTFNPFEN